MPQMMIRRSFHVLELRHQDRRRGGTLPNADSGQWAVCIITTNAASPNTQPMRRHRIDCLQKNRRLRGVLRRRPDMCHPTL
jgi:hypothetical protein